MGVTGKMLKWWFTWCDTGYKYKLWHPEDHVWCTWDTRPSEVLQDDASSKTRLAGYEVGRTHVVSEYLGKSCGRRAEDLHIQFMNPSNFGFSPEACDANRIAFVVCGRICVDDPVLGYVAAGNMIHIARENEHGLQLQSLFWLGRDAEKLADPDGSTLPPKWLFDRVSNNSVVRRMMLKDVQGAALLRHAFEEFHALGGILRRLFEQEAGPLWLSCVDDVQSLVTPARL